MGLVFVCKRYSACHLWSWALSQEPVPPSIMTKTKPLPGATSSAFAEGMLEGKGRAEKRALESERTWVEAGRPLNCRADRHWFRQVACRLCSWQPAVDCPGHALAAGGQTRCCRVTHVMCVLLCNAGSAAMHQSSCASTAGSCRPEGLPERNLCRVHGPVQQQCEGQGRTCQTCIKASGLPLLLLTSVIDLLELPTTLPSPDCWLGQ